MTSASAWVRVRLVTAALCRWLLEAALHSPAAVMLVCELLPGGALQDALEKKKTALAEAAVAAEDAEEAGATDEAKQLRVRLEPMRAAAEAHHPGQ